MSEHTRDADDVTFVFAGQGSQHGMMAHALFAANPVFRDTLLALDEVAGDLAGASVLAAMHDPARTRDASWDDLSMTHPAIFMVEFALARAVMAEGIVPRRVLGTSLGAFAAAAVAGVLTPEAALGATIQQAAAIEACCEPGGMLAVLASHQTWLPQLGRFGEVAAINFDGHFVMAAPDDGLRQMEAVLRAANVGYQRLPVRYAFHSHWIDPAQDVFLAHCRSLRLAPPRISIVCCERGSPLEAVDAEHFWRVVRQPIRLAEAVAQISPHSAYLDLGPSGTLATFLRYILPPPHRVQAVLARLGRDVVDLGSLRAEAAC